MRMASSLTYIRLTKACLLRSSRLPRTRYAPSQRVPDVSQRISRKIKSEWSAIWRHRVLTDFILPHSACILVSQYFL